MKKFVGFSLDTDNEILPNGRENERSQCPNCGQMYTLRHNMMRHLRLECGQEPKQQCPFCPHRFKRRNNMIRHIRTCHKQEFDKLVTPNTSFSTL